MHLSRVCPLVISEVIEPISIKLLQDVDTILPLNIFNENCHIPFRKTSLPNEGHLANFVQNWLPWQRTLRNRKKEVQIDHLRTNRPTCRLVKKSVEWILR